MNRIFDVVVLGSGLAGLTVALRLAMLGKKIGLITKKKLVDCNSYYAQGGIAAVVDDDDSFASHINDTLVAGGGLCRSDVVKFIVERAPHEIEWLINLGVHFTQNKDDAEHSLHLTREGGHSARRVLHVADMTGQAVIDTLVYMITNNRNISVFENHVAVDLICSTNTHNSQIKKECHGIYAIDNLDGSVHTFTAAHIVLATGGAGKAYLYTTNPDVATGDGIAMAYRAGAVVRNMEFVQFHPTCLYHPKAKSFLISEALRGEGGRLLLPNGKRFMYDHDQRLELAPRDIVARAIDFEMKKYGIENVYLDISYKPSDFVIEHFPNIYSRCLSFGIDITKDAIPVVPAAHYTCGGIVTNLSGETNINGLYAVGECASTGLHGANRLASNSLLECLVIGHSLADKIVNSPRSNKIVLPKWDASRVIDADEAVVIAHNWDELRRTMWDYVGIVRNNKRLQLAMRRIKMLTEEINDYYTNFKINSDLIELRNLLLVSELIVKCAMQRHESRGLHYSLDYQTLSSFNYDTLVCNLDNDVIKSRFD